MATAVFLCVILSLALTLHSPAESFRISRGCKLATNVAEEFLPTISYPEGVVLPERDGDSGQWAFDLSVVEGQEFQVRCNGRGNRLKNFGLKVSSVLGRCDGEGSIQSKYGQLDLDRLVCSGRAVSTATRNGTCAGGLTKVDIKIGSRLFYEVCHDERRSSTYYSKGTIDGPRLDESVSISRPSFAEADFYPEISAADCYKQAQQIETIEEIVGPNSYIQTSKNLFFARGHLMANGDGITADEKVSTFYFINVTPQWQTINGGNWERLESAVREYAEDNERVLTVWTGASGVGVLKDKNGQNHEIHLGKTSDGTLVQRIPAPRLLWKVVVDQSRNTGVAVVNIHNPYPEHHEDSDYVCPDVCDQLPWVTWDTENVKAGLTYCCSVDSFKGFVPDIALPSGLGLMK